MFVYLANKPNLSPNLDLIIKRAKLKHNNVFVTKLMSLKLTLSIYNIIILYIYTCTCIQIYLHRPFFFIIII
jgi:hypothetical protein